MTSTTPKDFALKGTIYPSFQLGINGPTLHQGTSVPDPSLGVDGDIFFIANGTSSGIQIKVGGTWGVVSSSTSATIGGISPVSNVFIVGNGTGFEGRIGDNVRTSFSLGSLQTAEFGGLQLGQDTSFTSKEYVVFGTTTDNTPTELFLDNVSSQILIPANSTWLFEAKISARRTDADNESNIYWIDGGADRQTLASTTQLVGIDTVRQITQMSSWVVDVNCDTTTGALKIVVTGENGKIIRWTGSVKISEVRN